MKNQLFITIPDINFLKNLSLLYGIKNVYNNTFFTKEDLIKNNTIYKILNLIDELKKYYYPNKHKIYLENINEKKCITIFRQFLKVNNFNLITKEKSRNSKKYYEYHILNNKFVIDFN